MGTSRSTAGEGGPAPSSSGWSRMGAAGGGGGRGRQGGLAYGLVLAWHLGGSSLDCQDLAVDLTGEAVATSCAWDGEPGPAGAGALARALRLVRPPGGRSRPEGARPRTACGREPWRPA